MEPSPPFALPSTQCFSDGRDFQLANTSAVSVVRLNWYLSVSLTPEPRPLKADGVMEPGLLQNQRLPHYSILSSSTIIGCYQIEERYHGKFRQCATSTSRGAQSGAVTGREVETGNFCNRRSDGTKFKNFRRWHSTKANNVRCSTEKNRSGPESEMGEISDTLTISRD
jgi:hypothetical protein